MQFWRRWKSSSELHDWLQTEHQMKIEQICVSELNHGVQKWNSFENWTNLLSSTTFAFLNSVPELNRGVQKWTSLEIWKKMCFWNQWWSSEMNINWNQNKFAFRKSKMEFRNEHHLKLEKKLRFWTRFTFLNSIIEFRNKQHSKVE